MVADLAGQVRKLQSNLSARELLIEHLQIQIAALRRQMYGRKSEKLETEIGQLELKLEELLLDNGEDPAPATPVEQERKNRTRKPLPEDLPRDTLEHLPSGDDCPDCGGALKPIGEDVAEQLEYVHADDTPVPMLAPGKGKTVTGRLWAYVRDERPAGSANAPALWMAFTPDRRGEHPQRHLGEFNGIIHADGFAGYDALYGDSRTQAACWAHARRKFYELTKSHPSPAAGEAVRRIAALYAIEEQIRGEPPDKRLLVRTEHSKPLLDSMRTWLDTLIPTLSTKSALAGAIQYALNRWDALNTFVQDGRAEIDNNAVERALRAVATGRSLCTSF
ncbi:IS66 family transposase [Robbsia andropogonis]|uniref:IS66 family transposase n=1 Tax=Robbsia andropogonis TaxID=28092 RepID=UPI002A6A2976|nr:IS66 family transposase [Robbsia andropogonis]